jgi:hypothetical protein
MIVSTDQHNNQEMAEVNQWEDCDDGDGQG